MVTKIIKTHSVHNGHVKKTLTFSTEENNISNETQALPFNQSSAFYSPNAPVMYSGWSDIGGFFTSTWNTFIGGFNKLGEGFEEGDFNKILTGIGQVGSPLGVELINELSKDSSKSSEEKKSILETVGKTFIDVANQSAEIAKDGAEKIGEGLLKKDLGEMLEGATRLENTHGEIVVRDVVNSSKGEFKTLIEALNRSSRTAGQGEDINKAIQKGDVQGLLKGIESLDKASPFMHDLALKATKQVFEKMVERLNEFSDELTNIASKLEKDIREGDNLDKIIKGIEELKHIDPEDTKLVNDQHSPTFEAADIDLHSEFILF